VRLLDRIKQTAQRLNVRLQVVDDRAEYCILKIHGGKRRVEWLLEKLRKWGDIKVKHDETRGVWRTVILDFWYRKPELTPEKIIDEIKQAYARAVRKVLRVDPDALPRPVWLCLDLVVQETDSLYYLLELREIYEMLRVHGPAHGIEVRCDEGVKSERYRYYVRVLFTRPGLGTHRLADV